MLYKTSVWRRHPGDHAKIMTLKKKNIFMKDYYSIFHIQQF